MTPDTSAEEVGRLADALERSGLTIAAATLRALLRERDELAADIASALRAVTAETEARTEEETVRQAWLHVIQVENSCDGTGKPCNAVRCGCAAEQEMLIREMHEARAALAGEGRGDG